MPPTPLTAIAQTPRKEPESKFTFNPMLAKVRSRCLFTRLQGKRDAIGASSVKRRKESQARIRSKFRREIERYTIERREETNRKCNEPRPFSSIRGPRLSIVEAARIASTERRTCFVPLGTASRSPSPSRRGRVPSRIKQRFNSSNVRRMKREISVSPVPRDRRTLRAERDVRSIGHGAARRVSSRRS